MSRARSASKHRPFTKRLFASGLQCAKRLYLEYHEPGNVPSVSAWRRHLEEVGRQLVELARTAFPKAIDLGELDFDAAASRTRDLLSEGKPAVLYDAAFTDEDVELRADIVVTSGDGSVDLFEVKSGTRVKIRHLKDVALQVSVIEAAGWRVRSANVLHIDPRYRHAGGRKYPIQQLFKSVDVTEKVRRRVPAVRRTLESFRALLDDPVTMELPTGTWCHNPSRCVHLSRCLAEAPEHPLLELPDLTPDQERAFHEEGIEQLEAIDPKRPGLTLVQRRALRTLAEGGRRVEPFVREEIAALPTPLHVVAEAGLLQVLPSLQGARAWQSIPIAWARMIVGGEKHGDVDTFVAPKGDDPRAGFVRSLAEALAGPGTLVIYGEGCDGMLRELLDELPAEKRLVRAILNKPFLDLQALIRAGVYDAGFRGSFALEQVHEAVVGEPIPRELEIADAEAADEAMRRLQNPRTHASTREKLSAALAEWLTWRARAIAAILERVRS